MQHNMTKDQKTEIRDLAQEAFDASTADYLEIRFENRTSLSITYRGKDLDEISRSSSSGGFIRALVNGGWGLASFTSIDEIPHLAQKAERAARVIGEKSLKLAPVEIYTDEVDLTPSENPADIPLEHKEALVHRYNDIIANTEKVQTASVSYQEEYVDRSVFTSEGTSIRQKNTDLYLIFSSVARDGDIIQQAFDMVHSPGDFSMFDNLDKKAQEIADRSVALLTAKAPEAGKFDIVTDPRLTGVFTHEAFGHLSEADFVAQNDSLREVMETGREFGLENLNIIDDGSVKDLPGCFAYDDEGVPMQKTYLIKEGKLTGRLHNRESAVMMGEEPTGNARAVSFFHAPVVRMTCTYIDRGDWEPKELIKDIDDGYYVKSSKGGQTNLEQFTFSGEEAFRIKDGEITDHVRDLNISGNLFETLKDIDGIGKDLTLMMGGFCGKGEHYPLPVSFGGPHMRIRNVVTGGG